MILESIFQFVKKHWLFVGVAVVVILGLLVFSGLWIFSGVKNWFNDNFGNPDTDQSLGTLHTNKLDAALLSLTGGTHPQTPADRTRTNEIEGLFQGAEGDRSLSDLTSNPTGFIEFMFSGNTDDLTKQ